MRKNFFLTIERVNFVGFLKKMMARGGVNAWKGWIRGLGVLCGMISVGGAAIESPNYNDQVLPIFRNACLNCHNSDKKKAGLDLSTYQGSLQGSENGKVLKSGDSKGSLLLQCVIQSEDPKMPLNANASTHRLTGEAQTTIRRELAANPGADQVRNFKIEGKDLYMSTVPVKDKDGRETRSVIHWTRLR